MMNPILHKIIKTLGLLKGRVFPPKVLRGMAFQGTHDPRVKIERENQSHPKVFKIRSEENLKEGLKKANPYGMRQLCHGRDIGIGGSPWEGYECMEL
jgi:hypothetical protein